MNGVIRLTLAATTLLALASATPVFAQGSGGDDSTAESCQNNLERQQLAVTAEKDPSRQTTAAQDLTMAKNSLELGNTSACFADVQQSEVDLR